MKEQEVMVWSKFSYFNNMIVNIPCKGMQASKIVIFTTTKFHKVNFSIIFYIEIISEDLYLK